MEESTATPATPGTPTTPSPLAGSITPGPATPGTPASPLTPSAPTESTSVNFQCKYTLEGHTKGVCSVKFAPNGRWLASCSPDLTIRIWKLLDGTLEKVLEDKTNGHTQGVSDITWSHDSQFIVSCSDDKTLKVWGVTSGTVSKTLAGHTNLVLCVSSHPKQHVAISGSYDSKIIIWNTMQGRATKIIPAHSDPVSAVSYNREGTLFVSGSYDGTCKLWNAETFEVAKVIVNNPQVPVSSAKFAPNGKILLVGTLDNALRLCNDAGALVRVYRGHKNKDYCLFSVLFVRTAAKLVITGSEDGSVFCYNLQSKQVLQKLENAHDGVILGLDTPLQTTKNLIATGGMDKMVKIWELTS